MAQKNSYESSNLAFKERQLRNRLRELEQIRIETQRDLLKLSEKQSVSRSRTSEVEWKVAMQLLNKIESESKKKYRELQLLLERIETHKKETRKSTSRNIQVGVMLLLLFVPLLLLASLGFDTTGIGITGAISGEILSDSRANSLIEKDTGEVTATAIPVIDSIVVNSSLETNTTRENLTAFVDTSDGDGDTVKVILDWRVNGVSNAILNMPMENYSTSSGAIDYSTHGNNGTLNGATFNDTAGFDGHGAFYFDGNDEIATSITIKQTAADQGATMMAWVYPTSVSNGRHHIFSTDSGGFDWSLLREGANWYVFTGSSSIVTGESVDINTWQHVAVVFDPANSKIRFYKDGVETTINAIGYDTNVNTLSLGRNPDYTEYFTGVIDEALVFNHT